MKEFQVYHYKQADNILSTAGRLIEGNISVGDTVCEIHLFSYADLERAFVASKPVKLSVKEIVAYGRRLETIETGMTAQLELTIDEFDWFEEFSSSFIETNYSLMCKDE